MAKAPAPLPQGSAGADPQEPFTTRSSLPAQPLTSNAPSPLWLQPLTSWAVVWELMATLQAGAPGQCTVQIISCRRISTRISSSEGTHSRPFVFPSASRMKQAYLAISEAGNRLSVLQRHRGGQSSTDRVRAPAPSLPAAGARCSAGTHLSRWKRRKRRTGGEGRKVQLMQVSSCQ